MLAADAPGLHVYYADDHFVPYEGGKPVPKGWNTRRRHAQPGRAGTMVTDYHGRAVCFADGEPSGLSATLPPVLAQLRQVLGTDAKILPAPRRYFTARGDGRPAEALHLADETVRIKDYGPCRQITLFEDGAPVLQVLTSDTGAPAAALLAWLRCRRRIENLFKYLEDNYGIHWLRDYHASLEDDDRLIASPERTAGRARLRQAEAALAAARQDLAVLLADPALTAAAKNKAADACSHDI